jgi:hypothetical protein
MAPDDLGARMADAFWTHAKEVAQAICDAGYVAGDIEWGSGPLGAEGWTLHYAELWSRTERRMLGKVWVSVVESPFSWEYHSETYITGRAYTDGD